MVDPTKITADLSTIRTEFPLHLMETQKQTAKFFSDINDLTSKTMRGILENQTELWQLEAHQASKALLMPKPGEEPCAALCSYWQQLHEQSERVLSQTRELNDVIRNYAWGLVELCTDNYRTSVAAVGQKIGGADAPLS